MVAQLRNGRGDRALVDFDGRGFVYIIHPVRRGRHSAPGRILVHYASTYEAALEGLRQLTGTDWRRA